MSNETIKAKMQAKIDARTTPQLVADLRELDTHRTADGILPSKAERLVASMISDTIERRHPEITEPLEAQYADDADWPDLYTDALVTAMTAAGVETR